MTSSLAKSKQIVAAHFHMLFFYNFLIFDVPQYSNRFDYIKDIRPAIYSNNQKSLHITFKTIIRSHHLCTVCLKKTSDLWFAITLTYVNAFLYFFWQKCYG